MFFREFLKEAHSILSPSTYVEIGIRAGEALRLSKCLSVGIDPSPQISSQLEGNIKVFRETSDDFFAKYDLSTELDGKDIDLGFIDGYHNFEYALRDFMNLEKFSCRSTIILVDDVKPRNALEAQRQPTGGSWTGDVYKLFYCLKKYRGDLSINLIDTAPTGLLCVSKLDPKNEVLKNFYNQIIDEFVTDYKSALPEKDYNAQFISPSSGLRFLESFKQGRTDLRNS